MATRRKFPGRFPDKPKLRPADRTVDGNPLIVRHPDRKNGRFPALKQEGEVVDCSAANPNRNYWYRRWRCGEVEIVGDTSARKPPQPPAPPADQE